MSLFRKLVISHLKVVAACDMFLNKVNLNITKYQKISNFSYINMSPSIFNISQNQRNKIGNKEMKKYHNQKTVNKETTTLLVKNNIFHKERLRKKKILMNIESPQGYKITAYCTAHSYNIEQLGKFFKEEGYHLGFSTSDGGSDELVDPSDILRVESLEKFCGENKDIYLFKEGMIVFWNFISDEQQNILNSIRSFENKSYNHQIVLDEVETINYSIQDRYGYQMEASRNLLLIPSNPNCNMAKFTISNAMAMSVKLGILEAFMEEYIKKINRHKYVK